MQKLDTQILVLAALLHDVGKFAQRAEQPRSSSMEGEYCPVWDGRPSHHHVLYSDHFIENNLPLPPELEPYRSRIARLASSHHKPAESDLFEKALCVGDRKSAGTDRIQGATEAGDYKSSRLACVFERISLHDSREKEKAAYTYFYPLRPMDEDTFPVKLDEARKTGFKQLFANFVDSLKHVPLDKGIEIYLSSILTVIERFTWCIPSSTYHSEPDISLYDHALTTSAIAQALAVYHDEAGGLPGEGASSLPKFLLLGGDLSGIQKYIFGIQRSHGSGVAKLFRARSFYLQVLTRSVILSLLDDLGLSSVARIMDAGGRFILLLPATKSVRETLPNFEKHLQAWFLERFKGELALNLSYATELTESDLDLGKFQKKLDEFNDHLELRKLCKFDLLIKDGLNPILDKDYGLFEHGSCAACNTNPVDPAKSDEYERSHDKRIDLCRECWTQIERIGSKLPRLETKYAVFWKGGNEGIRLFGNVRVSLEKDETFSDAHRHVLEAVNMRNRDRFAFYPVAGYMPLVTPEDMDRWEMAGWMRAFQDDQPEADQPKTLNVLARESLICDEHAPNGRGKAFLGAFKADVDNLGFIFSFGLGQALSISRFASMSRMLNHFFAGHMVERIRKDFPDIYVVFAGGDDLFLLGPWTGLIKFATELRGDLRRFTAQNSEITISGGIALSRPGLPIQSLTQQAEHLLEESKKLPGKDALTLFDVTAKWKDVEGLLDFGSWIEGLVLGQKITSGLANRLIYYSNEYREFAGGKINKGIYLSHMLYDFARNANRKALGETDYARLLGVKDDKDLMGRMRLPLSYALYRIRTE